MIVREIKCDICERTIVYKSCTFITGIAVHLSLFKEIHICDNCKKEIKEKILNKE